MGLLDGKVVLITGGARGQGRAHAVVSAREGADIAIIDIEKQVDSVSYPTARKEDLAETARQVEAHGRRALSISADVRSQTQLDDAVARTINEFGKIDVLIANAGIWTVGDFWSLSEDTWDDMIDINLTGVWKSAKAVAPHMIERQTGSIVITSSVNGLEPARNFAHYVAAKTGVVGLMQSIALELAPHGIRCNAVNPGVIKTPMTNQTNGWNMFAGHDHGTEEDLMAGGYHFNALKGTSFLPPEVIANTALYLNSDLAAAVTGVTIPVDAGHMILPGFNHDPVK
ncbi:MULTISPECIES: mycofactocin-coupled SDR family oxidoreductase [unclassified Rhodococcus (in: high G+C Gram-positive bacteria)]|jgi:SDR family mycofactocin-dependent oxidoreductase|uniref:mycofactocin-coupled SDR family oxidoreductase n=1 Tax=Rhodococcus sp. A14 TaxID=1194106 RepID=UPI000769B999|nr:oxidoreductase [Rhodococcus sp. SC4]NHU44956.1 mycofactocin-coupled SDR family oxidoreductase [Rhodococcus sp. A14]RZL84834.1 MAG: NAD(P)-dependent oxidoreductase [Rhodococcus sp. (in: high G+C Gram-positive bacteria)]